MLFIAISYAYYKPYYNNREAFIILNLIYLLTQNS